VVTRRWPVAVAPILWNNDDLPDLTPPVPFERVLDEIAAAGYEGTELATNAPRDLKLLRDELQSRGLRLAGSFLALDFFESPLEVELEQAGLLARLLREVGAGVLVAGPAEHPQRMASAGGAREPATTDAHYEQAARGLERVAERCRQENVVLAFHNHAGTFFETADELDDLCRRTNPDLVRLCLDVGHLIIGGGDPVRAIQRHGQRIAYVHMKDVDAGVLEHMRAGQAGFIEGLRERVFCELGHGCLDLPGVVAALREQKFEGWVVIEQDTSFLKPFESAVESRARFREVAGY
jgi:inosose dehydratase